VSLSRWSGQNRFDLGTSANAVKTQLWVAPIVYLLVAILKKQLGLEASLYKILQILRVIVFEKTPILQAFEGTDYELLGTRLPYSGSD
jgi:hypothetical protein